MSFVPPRALSPSGLFLLRIHPAVDIWELEGARRKEVEVARAWGAPRPIHDSETRPFFVTSEFLAYALFLMGLGITASISPSIDARFFRWIVA